MDAGSCVQAWIGGALVGASSSVLLAVEGRSEGVSGMASRVLTGAPHERAARLAFLVALAAAGLAWHAASPASFATSSPRPLAIVVVAGVLVGLGARVANGCTSGHGILGVSRLSRRSLVATAITCVIAAATVAMLPRGEPS